MRVIELLISDGRGGAETVVHNLAKQLMNNGIEVKIVINEEIREYFADLGEENLKTLPRFYNKSRLDISNKYLRLLYSYVSVVGCNIFYDKGLIGTLKNLILDYKPTIMHIHLTGALKSIFRCQDDFDFPVVFTMHGDMKLHRRTLNPSQIIEKALLKRYIKKVDYVTSACNYFFYVLEEAGISIDSYRKRVIPNGVDVAKFAALKPLSSRDAFSMVFTGGERQVKGGDILVNSLPLLAEKIARFRLYILRNVSEDNYMRKYVLQKNLTKHVSFIGYVNYSDYIRYIKSADVAILPSRTEGIAQSVLEFMACGKPIVATRVGGTPEIITEGENGILVENTPKSLAKGIICLYENTELRKRIGRNNTNKALKYSWDVIAKEYISFFRRIQHD